MSYQNAGANVSTAWVVKGAGDFNGDGRADIFWEKNDGNTAIWLMNGSTWAGEASFGPRGGGNGFQGIGDFNGDARADVLWRGINGDLQIWFNGGGVIEASGTRLTKLAGPSWNNQYVTLSDSIRPAPASTAWTIDRIADFNHDGRDDLLWRSGSAPGFRTPRARHRRLRRARASSTRSPPGPARRMYSSSGFFASRARRVIASASPRTK